MTSLLDRLNNLLSKDRELTDEEKETLAQSEQIVRLLNEPGWGLVLDHMEKLADEALTVVRQLDKPEPMAVYHAHLRWREREKVLLEVQSFVFGLVEQGKLLSRREDAGPETIT